jgi:hypothetical protein
MFHKNNTLSAYQFSRLFDLKIKCKEHTFTLSKKGKRKEKFGKQSKRSRSNQKGQFVSKRSKIKRFLISEKLF